MQPDGRSNKEGCGSSLSADTELSKLSKISTFSYKGSWEVQCLAASVRT